MNNSLKICHQNVQSLRNKVDLVEATLNMNDVDIACLTEHWFDDKQSEYLNIEGYNLISKYCRKEYKNGGVAIFCSNKLKDSCSAIEQIEKWSKETIFEVCGVKILLKNNNSLKIFCVYRSPSTDVNLFLRELNSFLHNISRIKNENIILCGDLNINYLSYSPEKNELVDILHAYGFDICLGEPTRCTPISSSAIDYICTNFDKDLYNISTNVCFNGISDHSAQFLELNCDLDLNINKYIYRRVYSSENYSILFHHLSNESWLDVYQTQDVNEAFEIFVNHLKYYVDVAFPIKKIYTRNTVKPWLTRGIKISARKMKELYATMIETGHILDKNYYKSYKKIYKKVIIAAKRLYNNRLYDEFDNKGKAAWTIINKSINKNKTNKQISEIKLENTIVKDNKIIANSFNDYFVGLPQKLSNEQSRDAGKNCNFTLPRIHKTMFLRPVSENIIYNAIVNLKKSHSAGVDSISSNLLKLIVNYITYPLTYLVNLSLEQGIFPEIFKIARVVPLYKKGEKVNIENYRPISLLSSISKVLERIVFDEINNFLTTFNILTTAQHGFRKNKSTTTAVTQFISQLCKTLDDNKKTLSLFMDLSKAFDLVNHALLKEKLNAYGLRGKINNWLTSYLYNRKQIVDINGTYSKESYVTVGVPQGSILGPLLFLIFVNDLPEITNSINSFIMFADDNTYLCEDSTLADAVFKLQIMINKFIDWFKINKLHLNTSKTVFINFTPRNSIINESQLLKIERESIAQVKNTKFLGLYIDNALNWEMHTDILCNKLSSLCFALFRLKNITNKNILYSFYHSQFVSRLRYGIIFWGSSSHLNRVFKLQKRAIRNIAGLSFQTSCRPYFKKLQLLTLPCIYILEILIYVKSNLNQFITNGDFHQYETRHNHLLSIPTHNLSMYEKSPMYVGIKLYNKLNPEIRQINSLKLYKTRIYSMLLDNVFYSVSEYMNFNL